MTRRSTETSWFTLYIGFRVDACTFDITSIISRREADWNNYYMTDSVYVHAYINRVDNFSMEQSKGS